jgi:hypothetical protein
MEIETLIFFYRVCPQILETDKQENFIFEACEA